MISTSDARPQTQLSRPRHALLRRTEEQGNLRLGLHSMVALGLAPLGRRAARFHCGLDSIQRQEHGLIIILPGIEGCSSINDSIARGLVASELPHAMMILDWRKFRPWNPFYLTMERHNRSQAQVVAQVVADYQRNFPGRSVHLIGHSAGAGMALFALEALPEELKVSSVILLAAAVSRDFNLANAISRTERGVWNFYSPLDLPTVGVGTLMFGTMDRRHALSAGALGFRNAVPIHDRDQGQSGLHQVKYRASMIRDWNFGGHFGATNAAFVRSHISPLLR